MMFDIVRTGVGARQERASVAPDRGCAHIRLGGAMKRGTRLVTAVFSLAMLCVLSGPAFAVTKAQLWKLLRDGEAFAMMRHALAPGTGDPGRFRIGDCSTQRNLNDEGRKQSRTIGAAFKKNGITSAEILTSQWCRCRQTAELLGLGTPRDLPAINSFFEAMERRDAQTSQLKTWLKSNPQAGPRILVSHYVNVAALTGAYTTSGEIVVATMADDGNVKVHGTLKPW